MSLQDAKARCANCNEDMNQERSGNWKVYCMKEKCKQAAMDEILKPKQNKMNIR